MALVVIHVRKTTPSISRIMTDEIATVNEGTIANRITIAGEAKASSDIATENMYVRADTGDATTID